MAYGKRIHLPHLAIMAAITHPIIQLLLHLIYNLPMASELLFTARGIVFRNTNEMELGVCVCLLQTHVNERIISQGDTDTACGQNIKVNTVPKAKNQHAKRHRKSM